MVWKSKAVMVALACMTLLTSTASGEELNNFGASYGADPFVSAETSCQGDCGFICACEPITNYSIGANLLLLGREKSESIPLLASPANLAFPTTQELGAHEMEFNVQAGVDVNFLARRPSGHTWELRYFGIYDQLGRERRTYTDGDVDTTNDMTIVHLNSFHGSYTDLTTVYSSDLHSGEVNVWFNERWGFEPVAGFRWMHQSEDLESFVTTDLSEGALIAFTNNMYGGQFGVRRVLWETPSRFRVEATLKGGVFTNQTNLSGETRTGGATTMTTDQSFSTMSYAGELTVSAVYQFCFCPYLSVRVGYNGLWLDRIGLAADQIDDSFASPGTTDLTTLIYQGGHLGFEYSW